MTDTRYRSPGMSASVEPAIPSNSYIPPGKPSSQPHMAAQIEAAQPPPEPATPPDNMSQAIAQQTIRLSNRDAWRAIQQALRDAGGLSGIALATAARAAWADRKALRRAARAAGLPWQPPGKAQRRRLSAANAVAPQRPAAQSLQHERY